WAPDAITLLQRNAARNGARVETLVAAWGHDADELAGRGPWDLVLAADVLYERRNVGQLLDLLPRLGAEVWLADPGRPAAPEFLEGAARAFAIDSAPDPQHPAVVHHTLR
ncbi:MAG: protein N-lysine methyltransferase family protein, partial [Actinomycetota bacterium]|nr:protein N-lysine methyltransferase family protein [Actinomycetota bacterium]